jgi:hypothetical protein
MRGRSDEVLPRVLEVACGLVGQPLLQGEGPGARMLAATLAWEELIVNGDREHCLELARFALADGELQRVDTGLLWVVASFTLEMGEVEMGVLGPDPGRRVRPRVAVLGAGGAPGGVATCSGTTVGCARH